MQGTTAPQELYGRAFHRHIPDSYLPFYWIVHNFTQYKGAGTASTPSHTPLHQQRFDLIFDPWTNMSSYLHPTPDEPIFGVNALKLWLKGDITTPGFLSSSNGAYLDRGGRDTFSLQELQRALYLAILEISLTIDPSLECAAIKAGGERWCVQVDVDEFYEGRDDEVKSLVDLDSEKRDEIISTYDREAVCQVLEQAREEIGWLDNEGRRLECHMDVAERLKGARIRGRFVFRPLARNWARSPRGKPDTEMLDVDDGVGEDEGMSRVVIETEKENVDGDGRKDSAREEEEKKVKKERLELFKREADIGFGEGKFDVDLEEGEVLEMNDSPLVLGSPRRLKDKRD